MSAAVVTVTLAGSVLGASGTASANWVRPPWDRPLCAKPDITYEEVAWALGGRMVCGQGFNRYIPEVQFSNGVTQIFVIGTDFGVWTRWWYPGRDPNPAWVSLGGHVSAGSVRVNAFTDTVLQLEMISTYNGRHMFNNRDANGNWSGWFR
ncbi:hypothetical protein [Kitasatospora sp. NPDC056184]|uniref:hypothetical protein n=1 Tax=Kitasatospora sp. NPDC056184 TaxID=3345738 RepID=UPI0035D77BEF